eukprot:CAMPEP_0183743140 /NCGR_PEP_ID=MMETSP0737-20130205/65063_1 /TAXON_ID=385413 /ORGANISM="Thalassiosira miniscula, Strain CCMP1093" /LENGTH=1006 /DNA_ID=CAMNT_0025978747 /DNA_START=257 /DNA_END=3275 /DNA_ORIENTATION=-
MIFAVTSSLQLLTVEAKNNRSPKSNDRKTARPTPTTGARTTETTKEHNNNNTKIFTNLNENYQSSSSSLDAVTKKLEDDFKVRQNKMRQYWKRTFEEIKESNPVVFPPEGSPDELMMQQRRRSGEEMLERWKQFLDSGGNASFMDEGLSSSLHSINNNAGSGKDNNNNKLSSTKPKTPLRFDGYQTWEKRLQQWSEDVSLYLSETEIQLNELLQPKDSTSKYYDLSTFGFPPTPSQTNTTKNLTLEEVDAESSPLARIKTSSQTSSTAGTTTATTLPIALTALDKTLPPIPKPRPVTPNDEIVPHTNIGDKSKNIWIVTTGALPWMTGTAVNPLLRAAYLSTGRKAEGGSVTLLLPWVERTEDQKRVYGGTERRFETQDDQEEYIRNWLRDTANMKEASVELKIKWYTAWQEVLENSLYSMGDLIGLIPEKECDICVLEEPEHLNWYRAPGENWTAKFKHVVGIVHTNYFVYATEQPAAFIRAPGMRLLSSWMCRAHCHRLIKLSGTLQQLAPEKELVENVHGVRRTFLDIGEDLRTKLSSKNPSSSSSSSSSSPHCHRLIKLSGTLQQLAPEKELVENVHGVRRTFLDIGEDLRTKLSAKTPSSSSSSSSDPVFGADATPTVYFIGKMLWSKGIGSLMDLMKYAEESADLKVKVDMYGGGPNKDEASAKAEAMGLEMPFHGPIDHAALGSTHKVFINPSLSEVLCTTVAEALAMGKFVVLPSHPSNDFFAQFPNCLPYANKEEFVGNLYYALTHEPEPLTEEYSYALSWEAATERFAAAGSVSVAESDAMKEALSSTEAGIEIDLPPLTTNEEQRKKLTRTFRRTRGRYRNFRSRLSQEITKSNVLPKELQYRLIAELDKRLDVDLDELLSSPKLRVKLSPAKLDKLLLELYDSVVEGPRGDVFRVIGGGATVGRQNLYVKQQQSKMAKSENEVNPTQGHAVGIPDGAEASTPTNLVKRALKRNLPQKKQDLNSSINGGHSQEVKNREVPKMSLMGKHTRSDSTW